MPNASPKLSGRDGQIRTADLSLRRRPLYPTELRPRLIPGYFALSENLRLCQNCIITPGFETIVAEEGRAENGHGRPMHDGLLLSPRVQDLLDLTGNTPAGGRAIQTRR